MAPLDRSSNLVDCIPYPGAFPRPRLRIDSRIAALPAEEEKQPRVGSDPQGKEVGDIFYFVRPRPRNPWAALGSMAFLSALLLALILIPLFRTDPLPKRETLTMLYAPPLGAAPSNVTRLEAPRVAYASKSIPAPNLNTQEAPSASVNTTGVVGGVSGGVAGDAPSGVFAEALSSTRALPVLAKSPEPTPVKRIRVAARVVEANLIHDVAPTYPPEAGRARIEGAVVLLAVIGKDGAVQDVRVESGLPLLAQAAMDAVKQWRYRPYLVNGEPVEVDSRITINFTLSGA
jgi:protein TonB